MLDILKNIFNIKDNGEIAQLARASALHAGGCGFKSHSLHQVNRRLLWVIVVISLVL